MSANWVSYKKWSLSLIRDVLAHLEYLLLIVLAFPKRVLEIGTGTGLHSVFVSYFGAEVIAIDKSPEMVKMASTNARDYKAKNVTFLIADASHLCFKEGSSIYVILREC